MTRYDRRTQALAAGLAGLAGFVDATGYIASGGFFLSFMSGNSTRLGIGLASAPAEAAMAASLILAFVVGVVAGALAGRASPANHRLRVLLLLAALLFGAAALATGGRIYPALLLTAMAMGCENTVFESEGEVRISLTYMTGNLVKIGQRVAAALRGGDRWGLLPYLMLWSAMLGGAVTGAVLSPALGLAALWVAGGAALMLAGAARAIGDNQVVNS